MPSPIFHLEILFQLKHAQIIELDQELVLGSISPDAIHMRPNQGWPDKAKTHFYIETEISYDFALEAANVELRNTPSSFRLGYLIHLYTDYLWRDQVYAPFFTQRKNLMEQSELHALYYNEMNDFDTYLLSRATWLEQAQECLNRPSQINSFSLLSQEEIESWRLKVLNQDLMVKEDCSSFRDSEIFNKAVIEEFKMETCDKLKSLITNF